jgi:flagellar M-ring protein FliF
MSALAEIPVQSVAVAPWGGKLGGLSRAQMLRLGLGIVVFLAVVIVGVVMGRQAEWRVLYANLADKDGGAVVAQLSQMNVPYQYAPGGGAILVPADKVYDTRLRLASLGLPKGSVTGFELMDSNRFGMTQFQERLTFQRGLEGELTRSIQALSSVQSARVHLALPNQNGFFREQQKPSASVLLGLQPGRTLDRSQLAGIIHLVSSSVPEMSPSAVAVLDDTGKLLSNAPDGTNGAVDAQQLQYVQQIEQQYSRRILDILEPVVGPNNVRAQVTAEVDFSQTESTSESHKPNQAPEVAAVRSQQVSEAGVGAGSNPPAGVPGSTTNQPPGPSSAPINGASAPLSAGGATAAAGTLGAGAKRESIINYEVDKTTRVVRGATGVVKRLSAAVVVNYLTNPEDKGKPVAKPLSEQQIEKMTALARESIGFSKDRGDSVNLMNAPFAVEKTSVNELPFLRQPEVQDLVRSLAWPVGTLLLGALLLMGFVRPMLKAVGQDQPAAAGAAAAGGQLDAVVANDTARPQLPPPSRRGEPQPPSGHELRLTDARQLAKENPMAVANIVKSWVNGEASA